MRYRRKRKDDDADGKLLRALAAERRRFGYRRLREMARRKGNVMNLKKVYRLYREEGLMVRRRRRRAGNWHTCAASIGTPANQVWSLDFVSDQLANGRRFRVAQRDRRLQQRGLAAVATSRCRAARVIRELDASSRSVASR